MRVAFTILMLASYCFAFSQHTFLRIYGDTNTTFITADITSDGGYLLVGGGSGITTKEIVLKIDPIGDVVWENAFEIGEYFQTNDIQETSDGGFVLCGTTRYPSSNKYFLTKYNAFGDTLWSRVYGTGSVSKGLGVRQTYDGGYILIGNGATGAPYDQLSVLKIEPNGDVKWSRLFWEWGIDIDGYSLEQTSDSGYIILGEVTGPGTRGIYVIKTDDWGFDVWSANYSSPLSARPRQIVPTSDGGYLIVGFYSSGGGFALKINSLGAIIWQKDYSLAAVGGVLVSAIETTDGGFAMCGSVLDGSNRDMYVLRTDVFGDTLWTRLYNHGLNEDAKKIIQTPDGGFFIAGYNYAGQGCAVKTDSIGDSGCNQTPSSAIISTGSFTLLTTTTVLWFGSDVYSTPLVMLPSAASDSILCLKVGVSEQSSTIPLLIHPNPTTGHITIESDQRVDAEVFNLMGQSILRKEQAKELDLSPYPKGIYLVKLYNEEGVVTRKVVLQ